jgi:hypothetical protein
MCSKGLRIFSALTLYYLLETLLNFPTEQGSLLNPAFATALFILLATHFFIACMFRQNMAVGNFVLELLAEMDG